MAKEKGLLKDTPLYYRIPNPGPPDLMSSAISRLLFITTTTNRIKFSRNGLQLVVLLKIK